MDIHFIYSVFLTVVVAAMVLFLIIKVVSRVKRDYSLSTLSAKLHTLLLLVLSAFTVAALLLWAGDYGSSYFIDAVKLNGTWLLVGFLQICLNEVNLSPKKTVYD